MSHDIHPGRSHPLGANFFGGGVNFSIFSRNCSALELLLFEHADDSHPARVIPFDLEFNRTFYYWHIFVKDLLPGQMYAYRARGSFAPERGLRYDGEKVLLDPYSRAVMYGDNYQREAAAKPGDNCAQAMKSVVVDLRGYDWEGDAPLQHHFSGTVIYELHVGGFTRHPNSGLPAEKRGTYAGLIEKIPYLKELGVTAVELLPVQQYDEQECPPTLSNYWGYSPMVFFAPHRGYAERKDAMGPVFEFKDMVKALHRADIEVILDVVFNHTAEGDQSGPTLCFKGLENRAYYMLEPGNLSSYANYSGCGNSINSNHSVVRRMIMDCLEYWVQIMHVDGFRFDLASVMSRDEYGNLLRNPPILWEIESDPILAGTKIIAEAWDAAGLYQVGSFIGHRWAEWNGKYRDDVRRFVKGDSDTVSKLAARLSGSRDLYPQPDREPNRSINFITCHDGFTLNDLVSYNEKHNQANLSASQEGMDTNFSWNCGAEGYSGDPDIESLRLQQLKNFITILLTSQGTPMLLMGDEVRRTQGGNNNAYCQDNPTSWFDWNGLENNADLLRFVQKLVYFYRHHSLFQQEKFWTDPAGPDIIWHGVALNQPDWSQDSHSLAFELTNPDDKEHLYIILNAYWKPLEFELPPLPASKRWQRVVDTSLASPNDFADPAVKFPKSKRSYHAQARSAVILKVG
jgi:isoamylase